MLGQIMDSYHSLALSGLREAPGTVKSYDVVSKKQQKKHQLPVTFYVV